MDSHEKQSPQRFFRYAAMLIMLLTLGVGQMWGKVVYYNNGSQSGTPKVYYWGGTGGPTWDGSPSMVNISGSIYAYDIGNNTKCIFRYNNASSQTSDLTVPNDSKNYINKYNGSTWSTLSTFTNSSTLYLLPNSNWKSDGARFAACFCGVTGQTWVSCSQVGTSDYYSVSVPASNEYPYVIFCRMNGANNTNSWSNKWNQSSDLAPNSKNGVEITGWDNSQNWITVYTGISVSRTPSAAANAPTITNSQTVVKSGSSVTINAQTEKTGYHWVNWTKTSGTLGNASNKSTTFTPSANSASAVANYAANTYTVAYNANDDQYPGTATGSTSSSSHTYGTAKALTSNGFSRAGYTFAGWATTPTGSVAYTNGQSVTNLTSTQGATVTLYAKWTENMSSVSLVASPTGKGTFTVGGSTVTSTTAGVTTTPAVTAVPIAGYSFSGWSITGGATISSTTDNPTTVTGKGAGAAATLTATFVEDLTYYDVTFGVGTSYTSLGSISATNNTTSSSISSGDDLLSGTSVTFTASPNTGYTVEGWYTDAACTLGKHDAGSTTYSILSLSSAVTVYVKFVEKTWSVAFAAGTGGTVTTPAATPQTVGQVTGISIEATPSTGYTFNTWTISSGSGSFTSAATTNSNTFKPTAVSTITASFNETMSSLSTSCHYDVGNPAYAAPTKSASSIGIATTSTITATAAGTGYTFIGWTLTNCTRTDEGGETANPITIRSNGDGVAASVVANYRANTYSVQFDPNNAQYAGAAATGTMSNQDFTYGVSQALSANGFSREGYTFAGWATSPTGAQVYNDGQSVSNLTSTNGATVTLYAKWTGRTYTVTFNARGGSSLSPASKTVTMGATYGTLATVTPPAGKVFSGWYTSAGGGTLVESTTQVTTASDHTLYAHYAEKAQVYFKNTLGWSKVYVVYDASWDGSQGTGSQDEQGHERVYREMTKVAGTSDVYYDNIPDEYITSWRWNIAFNNTYQYNYHAFTKGEAVFRYPTSNTGTSADGNYTKNGVQYRSTGYPAESTGPEYTSGYWRTYNNTYSGYTMTYQKKDGPWSSGHKMESSSVSSNVFIYTVHMDANSQYNFAFYKERDLNFKSVQFCYDHNTQITSNNCTNLVVKCEPQNSWMKTTVEGDYVFKLEMKNDGHMYLSVEYPFKANDYKVVYSYTKDGAKTYDSEIIRGRANGLDTISVFIHSSSDASSRSLKIAQCTEINASGVPTWNNSYATIDISSVSESGVYDFIITQDGSAVATGAYWNKYTGNYYIRTAASDGGWDMYKYRPNNIMTLSEYSLTQTLSDPFSHYYCRFIGSTSVDITYAVATDYSPNISGTMTGDATIGVGSTTLPATANVRFSWNEKTNAMRRAYLKNAQGAGNNRYLVLHGADNKIRNNDATGTTIPASGDLAANELLFYDLGNWVYQVELKAIPGAKVSLIANYNSADRYLVGDGDTKWETIIGGSGSSLYSIRAVYDFKTNRLMTAWIPGGEINENISDVDVLLLRYAQNAGTAITFGGEYKVGAKEVIGAIEMRYNDLVGHVANWTSSSRPLLKFFVSFPFDVNVSDIFGLNSAYGDAYIVEEYDGAGRAEKGFFGGDGTTTFWREMEPGDVMKANVGYCVILDNDYFNGDIGNIWDNKSAGSSVYLYFPSASSVGDIQSSSETISIPEHLCHHDRTFITGGSREVNHINTDSHWNMMGVPIFDTHSDPGTSGQPGEVFATSGTDGDGNFNYFYEWNPSNNQYSIHTAVNYSFKCMHGYMVQYHGNVTFKTAAAPASVAARRAPQKENYQIELQVLNNNADVLNSAFVELRENACDTFELNEDVYMSYNNYAVNIYTLTGNYDVAANVLSINDHTIPVGVKVTKAGTYRFSMPGNFSGEVTLLDTFTGESTNLALDDYEVELPKGTTEDRFFLKTNIKKVATAIDGISEDGSLKDGKAHKFLQNGVMYILQNGVLYDAQGKRVQ